MIGDPMMYPLNLVWDEQVIVKFGTIYTRFVAAISDVTRFIDYNLFTQTPNSKFYSSWL